MRIQNSCQLTTIALLFIGTATTAQQRINLWPAGAVPGALGTDTLKDIPCIYVYQPAPALRNGSAMVICPGGGYTILSMALEGSDEASFFNQKGMTCFVLSYRLCSNGYTRYPIRNDGIRAMRLVRARAKEWDIDTTRLGVMGFSAGGHMASMMSTQFDAGNPGASDTIERASSRPAFSVLVYPVITVTLPYAWSGLRSPGNFIGPSPSAALVDSFSSERQITRQTPKAFLVHDYADGAVPYQNTILYRDSCLRKMVPAVFLRVYNCNPSHGFGLACGHWADSVATWMSRQGIFTPVTGVIESNPPTGKQNRFFLNHYSRTTGMVRVYDIRGRCLKSSARSSQSQHRVVIYQVTDKSGNLLYCGKKILLIKQSDYCSHD